MRGFFGILYTGFFFLLLFLTHFLWLLYVPGPTFLGVSANSFNVAAPLISLLYPKVYFVLLGLCKGWLGLYYGPGVALYFLGSFTNLDSRPIRVFNPSCLLFKSASFTSNYEQLLQFKSFLLQDPVLNGNHR